MRAKVEGHDDLARDLFSGAVLCVDAAAKRAHIEKRNLHNRVASLEQKMQQIDDKLNLILERIK